MPQKPDDLVNHPVIVAIHERLTAGTTRMDKIESDLATNTQLTTEMHSWLKVGKSGLQVLGWMGHFLGWGIGLAAGIVALYGSYKNWSHK